MTDKKDCVISNVDNVLSVILTVVYLFIITPIGIIFRLFKKCRTKVELDKNTSTYWNNKTSSKYKLKFYLPTKKEINILGISGFYHDSAAALIQDGNIIAAAEEERFTRIKHDPRFPQNAIKFCLEDGKIKPINLDAVVFFSTPSLMLSRIFDSFFTSAPRGLNSFIGTIIIWLKEKLWIKRTIMKSLRGLRGTILFTEHHQSHAASAFFPSPFQEAAILTIDGVGEWATASIGIGIDNKIELLEELYFPDSLGLLYSAFTYYLGFKIHSGEYKVMGLAPYGEPKYVNSILEYIVDIKEDGSLRLNKEYFNFAGSFPYLNEKFRQLFDVPERLPETTITQKHMDLACSIQEVCELAMLRMAKYVAKKTGMRNLCMAGGVALNCVANSKILKERIFDNIWIQPAATDAGGSIGAALLTYYQYLNKPRKVNPQKDSMNGSFLGPQYTNEEIEELLKNNNIPYQKLSYEELIDKAANLIADGNVIGWFQGRMEFGPRSLGARSILADPRNPSMQKRLNLKIKFREGFRPFAPSILEENLSDYFELNSPSPYMLLTAEVKKERRIPLTKEQEKLRGIDKLNTIRSDIPAVTHIDYSARIQTVTKETNPVFYDLIKKFHNITGCPVLINTSFNVRGEPIVCTPKDAITCFCRTGIDYLVIGNYVIDKKNIPYELLEKHTKTYENLKLD